MVVGLPAGSGGDVVARFYADKLSQSRRQAGDRREQAGHDPFARRRRRGEVAARWLHHPDHLRHVVACGQPVQFQEAALRSDQGLHASRNAAEELFHPDGPRRRAIQERCGIDRGDEEEGRQGELRLRQPAGAGVCGVLQVARGPEGCRHSLQDFGGIAVGNVQRRTRLPVHRLHLRHAASRERQASRARRHLGPACAGCRHPDHGRGRQHSRIRHCAGVGCAAAGRGARRRSSRRVESWFGEISKMDDTRRFLGNTHAAPFPGGAKDLAAFIPKEIEKWRNLAAIAKIEPQ